MALTAAHTPPIRHRNSSGSTGQKHPAYAFSHWTHTRLACRQLLCGEARVRRRVLAGDAVQRRRTGSSSFRRSSHGRQIKTEGGLPCCSLPNERSGSSFGVEAGEAVEEREAKKVHREPDSPETVNGAAATSEPPDTGDPELSEALSTRERLLEYVFVEEGAVEGCTLKVAALRPEWLDRTKDILTGAFSDAMGYLPAYKTLLSKQIDSYLQQHMKLPPLAIVLVAVLESERTGTESDASEDGVEGERPPTALGLDSLDGNGEVREGSSDVFVDSMLVGTLELSFRPATRSRSLTLNPPERCAYLCNMAIDSEFRRQGYGTKLLRAGELFAKMAGEEHMYLHVRLCDPEAQALYLNNGYAIVKTDNVLAPLLGVDRRHLMKKDLL